MRYLVMILAAVLFSTLASAADLTVVVTNFRKPVGNVIIGIFDKASDFPNDGKQLRKISVPIRGEKVTATISDLPEGEYALAICHDENVNNDCDCNFLGIPQEGIAFSNNFKPKLKKPKFSSVKFKLVEDKTVTIRMLYL